jgi:chorismate mutase
MEMVDVEAQLGSYRQTIDNIDAALVHILSERFRCTDKIGLLKAQHDLPPADKGREDRQFARIKEIANHAKIDERFVEDLMMFIISEVVSRHIGIAAKYETDRANTK